MAEFVLFRGSRADVSRIAQLVARILSGREPDRQNVGRGFLLALGFAALSDIKDAYIQKSRGGTDEMGITWPPLSKNYLAYGRRFGRGEQARLKRKAGLGRAHRRAPGDRKGLLTGGQLRQWRRLYAQFLERFLLSEPERAAKSHAAAVAWTIMKRRGAQTKLQVFGSRQVDILRDTGVLLNSLGPGLLMGEGPSLHRSLPQGTGSEEQIFETQPGMVIVGTNVEYATSHQQGIRPFLPDEKHPVPDAWWQRWTMIANRALVVSIQYLYRTAA